MRIHLLGEPGGSPYGIRNEIQLDKIFTEQQVVRAVIRRVTPHTVFLHLDQLELELPVASIGQHLRQSLRAGLQVELSRVDEGTVAVKVLAEPYEQDLSQATLLPRELESVLVELNIPPTPEAVMVAQELLQRGFALKQDLLWLLVPWAEKGRLEEAFQLLQARFPLEPNLVEMASQLRARDVSQPLHRGAKQDFSSELQDRFRYPSWEGRAQWSDKFADGEVFKTLVRLVVEERFMEGLSSEFVFALPFLRGDDLYASWVRISKDDDSQSEGDEQSTSQAGLKVEFQIPTAHLGVVYVELWVREKTVHIRFQAEENGMELLQEYTEFLREDLAKSGWELAQVRVGGGSDA